MLGTRCFRALDAVIRCAFAGGPTSAQVESRMTGALDEQIGEAEDKSDSKVPRQPKQEKIRKSG